MDNLPDYQVEEYGYARRLDSRQKRFMSEILEAHDIQTALDVGGSRGVLSEYLAEHGVQAFLTDINPHALRETPENVFGVQADVSNLPFRDNAFDLVTCMHVLEHIQDWQTALAELERVTAEGGHIALAYPWEPIRGLFATVASKRMYGNIFHARKIHVHNLRAKHIDETIDSSGLSVVSHQFSFFDMPQTFTLLRKGDSTSN